MSNQGFQPAPTNHGFVPPSADQGSQPSNFGQGGFHEVLNSEEMMAFAKGSMAGVPIGYDHGFEHGAAKAASRPAPTGMSLGFVDTNESKVYGQGYQYGFAQGFSLGYVEGLKQPANRGFVPPKDDF